MYAFLIIFILMPLCGIWTFRHSAKHQKNHVFAKRGSAHPQITKDKNRIADILTIYLLIVGAAVLIVGIKILAMAFSGD